MGDYTTGITNIEKIIIGFILVVLAFLFLGPIQSYRAFPAEVACKAKQMKPERRYASVAVICVPYPTRRDTLAIERLP